MDVTTEMNRHQNVLNVDARLCTTADSDKDGWCSHYVLFRVVLLRVYIWETNVSSLLLCHHLGESR